MRNLDTEKSQYKPVFESQAVDPVEEVVDSIEGELTDEQLLQMAEGGDSWGANCNKDC